MRGTPLGQISNFAPALRLRRSGAVFGRADRICTCDPLPQSRACIDLGRSFGIDGDGRWRFREIVGVPGRAEGDVIETGACAHRTGKCLAFSSRPRP
jgi:hypothetical protein